MTPTLLEAYNMMKAMGGYSPEDYIKLIDFYNKPADYETLTSLFIFDDSDIGAPATYKVDDHFCIYDKYAKHLWIKYYYYDENRNINFWLNDYLIGQLDSIAGFENSAFKFIRDKYPFPEVLDYFEELVPGISSKYRQHSGIESWINDVKFGYFGIYNLDLSKMARDKNT